MSVLRPVTFTDFVKNFVLINMTIKDMLENQDVVKKPIKHHSIDIIVETRAHLKIIEQKIGEYLVDLDHLKKLQREYQEKLKNLLC